MSVERRPFPPERRLVVDWTRLGMGSPRMLALLEVDVTDARRRLRLHRLSFTAWLATCLARALARHPEVHAYRDLRGRLVLFDGVDLTVSIEVDLDGRRFPLSHVLRGAHARSVRSLHDEIRAVKPDPARDLSRGRRTAMRAITALPGPVRRTLFRALLASPERRRRLTGTAALSSVGMMGPVEGWAVAAPTGFSLFVLAGAVATRPRYLPGRPEPVPREVLHLTLNFDHDIVDGGPATRFAAHLVELLESADGLEDLTASTPTPG